MSTCQLLAAALMLLCCARSGYGMSTERIGPNKNGRSEILRHDSLVYSLEHSGDENFYFKATPDQIGDLVKLYGATRLRDHVVIIKKDKPEVRTFHGDKVDYNVNYHSPGGMSLYFARHREEAETYEPTLTIFVDRAADPGVWKKITLPDNTVLINEAANCPLKSKAIKPQRRVWFARVNFDNSRPAADSGVRTIVTLWEKNVKTGIHLGDVNHEGYFHAAFSDKEIADLKAGKSWLTLTLGNWYTEAKKDDPKLSAEKLSLDKKTAQPVTIAKPEFYYGRILFEDGSPPILVPVPWPGAAISVEFPFGGIADIGSDGYFKVYFTKEQYENFKTSKDKPRNNIYIPSYKEKNMSGARFLFPASKLSRDKKTAGVVKIPFPNPQSE
jgi:hypothetical protein